MKDALGHGSNANAAQSLASGPKSAPAPVHDAFSNISDRMYHDTMPIANYTGQVQDMLGMWSGSQKPEPLSASETKQVNDSYAVRGNWRQLARDIQDQRRGYKA
jgi:hypothetical protein